MSQCLTLYPVSFLAGYFFVWLDDYFIFYQTKTESDSSILVLANGV